MKKILTILAIFLVFLAACAPQDHAGHSEEEHEDMADMPKETTKAPAQEVKAAESSNPIKLGVSLPLSGEAASFGDAGVAGVEFAVKEVNDAGGVNGRMIEIVYEDDKCDSTGVTALTKLVQTDNVDAIIGPVCSSAAGPGVPVVQESKTPILLIASAPHLTQGKDYVFRVYPSDAFLGKFLAKYVTEDMGKQKVALVYVKNDWGQGIRDEFVKAMEQSEAELVFEDSMNQDDTDARTLIAKVKAAKPEVVVAPLYPAGGLVFIKQAKQLGLDVPIIGGDAWDGAEVVESGEADDILIAVGNINNPDDFQSKAKALSGKETNIMTPIAYDGVKVLAQVWSEVGTDKAAVQKALTSVSHVGLSTPTIEFDEEGDLKKAEYQVKVVKDKKALVKQ